MLIFVPLSHIDDNPYQRRSEYGDIAELAGRIAAARESYPETRGLMQVPRGRVAVVDSDTIVDADSVRMFASGGKWNEDPKTFRIQLAFGHRRLRAFRHLHETGAPGYEDGRFPVHIDPLTSQQMLDAVWAENYDRKDTSAVEQAELILLKMQQLGENATHAEVGAEWGLSRPVISNRLRLLELPADVQQANRDGRLSERQALALAPVIRIGELVDGRVEWGSKIGEQWGSPASPEKYIEYVLANPDKATSDTVRDFTKKLTDHAGRTLPGWLAKEKFDGVRGIEQSQCKGCPFRIDQSCLRPQCLEAKLEAWPDMALAAFSAETGIPISDRAADFELFNTDYRRRRQLRDLYEAGETGGGMVCSWKAKGESGARPYGQHSGEYVYNVADEKDGRCGIVLGYRGTLPEVADDREATGPIYDMPPQDDVFLWKNEAGDIVKEAHKVMVAELVDALQYQVNDWDLLQAFIFPADKDWIDDTDKLAKLVADFLIGRGRGLGWSYHHHEFVRSYQAAVDRAGLKVNVLGSAEDVVEKTAVLILDHWYRNHITYMWQERAGEVTEMIAAWQQLPGAAASPMVAHIDRAKRHIEQKIENEGRREETAVSEEAST